jgi:ribosomal protein S18 acetylase RimI-like enzyme
LCQTLGPSSHEFWRWPARSARTPTGWSPAVNVDWLERFYFDVGVSRKLDALRSGELGACASLRAPTSEDPVATVTSLIRPGCEHLWTAQLAWIEARVEPAGETAVRVISECLTDHEARRWADAGYQLVFEELAMERSLAVASDLPPRWPRDTSILEWGPPAAEASFQVYVSAFRTRPGFPAWSRSEWIERLTGDEDFLPQASLCALRSGVPAGFVVCSKGWINQVGVEPAYRRLGIASALVAEAMSRMRALGIGVARLHVNINNSDALATWRRLGFRECGRRGRFERVATHAGQATG